ncbi:putative carbon catabolite repressor protein 4 -like protein 3-like isoform X2 [Capsicum annuum]|nr:putative carbon catabolite repressor protein 4 -like protein 3-like isoform X2 [Capsicum annuum]
MGLHRNNTSLMITSYSRWCYNLECRKWIDQPPEIVRHCVESVWDIGAAETLTVVSYNILGDRNVSNHEDPSRNVPRNYLDWNHHRRVICEKLLGLNPDIICLQEVDKYYDLLNILEKAGYLGAYKGFLSICPGLGGQSCLVPIAGGKWQVVAEFIWVQLLMPFILSVLSQGSIGNNLSTSHEVVVWSAYTLPSPDPTMLEYTGYSDGLTPTKVPDILPVNVLKKTDFGPLPNKMTWCLIAHLGCIHPSRTTGSPNLVTTSTLYAESVKFYLKLGSDHLALVSEFEFLEVVGDKKEATEDHTIMSCCCIASSSRMTHPKFITSAATRSFRLLFNICSMGLHGKSTSSRSLLTAGGGTTRNVADRSVQHRKLFVIGWKQLLFAVANTKEVDKYYDLPNILEKAGYLGAYKLLEGESIELRQYGLRDNVAQLSVFEVVVGNCKLLFLCSAISSRLMGSASDERMLEIWIIGWAAEMLSLVKLDLGFLSICSSLGGQSYLVPVAGGKWQAHILSEKWDHVPIVLAGDYNSTPQLNLMLRNRKELSGQRRCHPSQVLGLRRERGSLFVLMDRRIILEEDGTKFRVLTEKISEE